MYFILFIYYFLGIYFIDLGHFQEHSFPLSCSFFVVVVVIVPNNTLIGDSITLAEFPGRIGEQNRVSG